MLIVQRDNIDTYTHTHIKYLDKPLKVTNLPLVFDWSPCNNPTSSHNRFGLDRGESVLPLLLIHQQLSEARVVCQREKATLGAAYCTAIIEHSC